MTSHESETEFENTQHYYNNFNPYLLSSHGWGRGVSAVASNNYRMKKRISQRNLIGTRILVEKVPLLNFFVEFQYNESFIIGMP